MFMKSSLELPDMQACRILQYSGKRSCSSQNTYLGSTFWGTGCRVRECCVQGNGNSLHCFNKYSSEVQGLLALAFNFSN